MEEKKKIKFVIDFSWLHSRSKYAFKDLTWEVDGVKYGTGTIYGVYDALMGVFASYGKNIEVILAMDGIPKKHQKLSGGYKGGRSSDENLGIVQFSRWDVAKQFTVIPQIKLAYHKNMEADETMSYIARTKKDDEVVIIFSGDGDLRQEINSQKNVFCCNKYEKDVGFVLEDENHLFDHGIKDLDGLYPYSVALHLAITGDSSDGIYGITRFLKKVSKAISNEARDIHGLKRMVEERESQTDDKVKKGLQRIHDEWKQVETNWLMTYIDPLFIPKYFNIHSFNQEGQINLEWFDKYGCQKIYPDLHGFLGKEIKAPVLDDNDLSDSGQALKVDVPDNNIMGAASEFDFGE
jgi:5'-3' exonuclease